MRSIVLNIVFLAGCSCVLWSAFLFSFQAGLFVLGVPLMALSLHLQGKVKK
jgi:hypothetical protein